jgi:glyoxylate/hydroxypyruvate reductase A
VDPVRVVITSPLEPTHVDAIARTDPRLDVVYEHDLIAAPRYASDHPLPEITADGARDRWAAMLATAEVMFDFGPLALADKLASWPRLRWIQASSAGVGQLARTLGLTERRDLTVTTASGVHARPLAEFVLLAVLLFAKDTLRVQADQRVHRWQRYAGEEVAGKVIGIVGAGRIGREAARLLRALDAHIVGVVRSVDGRVPAAVQVDELVGVADLDRVLPRLDVLILVTPHTPETDGLIDARRLALLPARAILINVARGEVVDEEALAGALARRQLRGAALDVFQTEPLPVESPLWDMPNVLVSPHSASTVAEENDRIVALFCDNLVRYLAGEPLRNVLDTGLLY